MGAGGDGGGNGATVTVGAEGVTVGAGGVVGLEQAGSAKPISITIDRRMSLSDTNAFCRRETYLSNLLREDVQ